jgi:hypothetical protein
VSQTFGLLQTKDIGGLDGLPRTSCMDTSAPFFPGYHQQPKLLFLATLHFPNLTRLLNDPICHDPCWPPMSMKFPSDIPNFENKPNEDPGDHVTTFHLWCSSNSLKDDSIQLRLFQCSLIASASSMVDNSIVVGNPPTD